LTGAPPVRESIPNRVGQLEAEKEAT